MCVIRNRPFTDTFPWDTAEQMEAAPATMPAPESWAAMSATDAEDIDGRYCRRPAAGGR